MKTVFINGSPKKRFSASGYFGKLQSIFIRGEKVFLRLRTKSDHKKIFEQIIDADVMIFLLPLYVDCVPAHILSFLREMERFCKEHKIELKIYAIANNGFIEGTQNAALFRVMENFCTRSDLLWCGGIGIGGGVMFNALKVVSMIECGIFLLSVLISGIFYSNWFPRDAIQGFLFALLVIFALHAGAIFDMMKMGLKVNQGAALGEKYTRILLPSFLFILIADVFFIIVSLFQGGLFKGWLQRK
mgnify:FL=1